MYPVINLVPRRSASLGSPWPCGHQHPELNGLPHRSLGYGHPPPPGVCCQATPDGGTICSDGFVGPAGWPKCPTHNVPGVAEYENQGGLLIPKKPTPDMCAGGAGSFPTVPVIGGLAAIGLAFFLLRWPMIPYRPVPVVNRMWRLGVQTVPVPSAPYISIEKDALGIPAPAAYKEGDRVQIVAWPRHDPYHKNATIEVVNQGPAYGVNIDGMEDMGIHKWYVGQELRPGPQYREIGPVVLVPDVIMTALGALGIGGSLLIKNPTASMVTLMVGAMAFAVGIHGTLMRVTQGAVSAAVKA